MYIQVRNRDITVGIAPRLLVRQVRDSGSISGRNKRLLSSAERKRRSGANKNSYSKDSGGISPRVKRKGHKMTAVFHHLQRLRIGGAILHTSMCLHEMHRKSFSVLYVHVVVRGRSVSNAIYHL